jgi:hypothetical protein
MDELVAIITYDLPESKEQGKANKKRGQAFT